MFSFKSAGKKITDPKYRSDAVNIESLVIPIGIKTPLEVGNDKSEIFKMHVDPLEQLADNLRNLVQTNHGDRLGRFRYGCNLKEILFNRNSSLDNDYEKTAIESIQQQVKKFMPVLNINNIDIQAEKKLDDLDKTSLSKVIVKVNFSVPALRRLDNSIEVVLYNAG